MNSQSGWLFCVTSSVAWNALIYSLSFNLEKPGSMTIAYVIINPVTKLHDKIEKINEISKKSIWFLPWNFIFLFWEAYNNY